MMRGRPRQPTATLALKHGTVYSSKYPGRDREPRPGGKPVKPKWLNEDGKHFWRDQVVSLIRLGVVTKQDTAVVSAACLSWQDFVGADTAAEKDKAFARLMRCLAVLGLTPADRSKVAAVEPKAAAGVVSERKRA